MSAGHAVTSEQIVVDVPARPRSLRLLRLAAADAAADLDFDIDGVESARIAVDELASLLLATGGWGRLVITIDPTGGLLRVTGRVADPTGPTEAVEVDRVVEELLGMCVDKFTIDADAPSFEFSLSRVGGGANPVGPTGAAIGST